MSSPALSRSRSPVMPPQDGGRRDRPPSPRPPEGQPRHRGPIPRFRYDLRRGDWAWSPAMFEVQGLPAGSAEPTAELLLQHLEPDDRPVFPGPDTHRMIATLAKAG